MANKNYINKDEFVVKLLEYREECVKVIDEAIARGYVLKTKLLKPKYGDLPGYPDANDEKYNHDDEENLDPAFCADVEAFEASITLPAPSEQPLPYHLQINPAQSFLEKNTTLLERARILSPKFVQAREYIGECFLALGKKFIMTPQYYRYSEDWKIEMIGDAVLTCWKYMHNFNPQIAIAKGEKPNPFAYFTQTVKQSFQGSLDSEKENLYAKNNAWREHPLSTNPEFYIPKNQKMISPMCDAALESMIEFEKWQEIKKERQNKKKLEKEAAKAPPVEDEGELW